jgi:hypothetical protein
MGPMGPRLVYINATPEMPVLGRRRGTQVFRSVERYPDGETYPVC